MPAAQVPENFWLLADPSQEILVVGRPEFCQVAPVPLRHLSTELLLVDEPQKQDADGRYAR